MNTDQADISITGRSPVISALGGLVFIHRWAAWFLFPAGGPGFYSPLGGLVFIPRWAAWFLFTAGGLNGNALPPNVGYTSVSAACRKT